jgi:diaminopimelate epimerase
VADATPHRTDPTQAPPSRLRFVKGHGTRNDFVLVPDHEGSRRFALTSAIARALADRRAGIGGDGVIRVARTADTADLAHLADAATWCMDYRNADGSVSEMCGNGIRVLAHYLVTHGLVPRGDALPIATRGGVRSVRPVDDGMYAVRMGPATIVRGDATVQVGQVIHKASAVFVPNPHAVVLLPTGADDPGDFARGPLVGPADTYPDGANVELVRLLGPGHVAMRVWERGVGETQSCGTGACAAAVLAMRHQHLDAGVPVRVDVPGGRLQVHVDDDGEVVLTGPAELVAAGEWFGSSP